MSGECNNCGEHCLDCKCDLTSKLQTCLRRREYNQYPRYTHLNPKIIPISDGITPPAQKIPDRRTVDVCGRKEHEAILKSSERCKELGLDQYYEIMVYLKRWGNWLDTPSDIPPA